MPKKGKRKAVLKSSAGTSRITTENSNPCKREQGTSDRVFHCLVEGDTIPFKVTIAADKSVDDLKKVIKTEREESVLRGIDPKVLVLWKLNKSVPIKPAKTLVSRLDLSRDSISHIAAELEEIGFLRYFLSNPPKTIFT